MSKIRKIFAAVLCLAMVLSMVPAVTVGATESYVEFSVNSLGLESNAYTAGTATVSGVAVEWIQLGNYGNGIQMRDSEKNGEMRTSRLWNTSAFPAGITKIEFTYSANKSPYADNNMIVNFGSEMKGADSSKTLVTVAEQKDYVIVPDSGDYTYFYIEWDTSYSSYWDSIKVYYGGEFVPGGDTTEPGDSSGTTGDTEVEEPDEEPLTVVPVSTALDGNSGETYMVKGVVTLVDGKNVYVQDETGAICVRMSSDFEDIALGDTIIGTGSRADYNGLPQLGSGTYEKSEGYTLSAKEVTIATATTSDICTYVKLTGLTVTVIDDGDGAYQTPNVTLSDGENEILLYKGVIEGISVGDVVDITCAVSCYKETLQLRNTLASEIVLSHKHSYTNGLCSCGEIYFPDVNVKEWYYNSVKFAVTKGYFTGYKSGNFGPNDKITRQDFVVVLARIAKVDLSQYSGRTSFPDVKAGDYYEKAVKWASSNGIVNGYKNGNFGVGDQITREQMVTILYNFAQKYGYDVSVPESAAAKLSSYTDAGKITGYAKPAVIWALYKGVISGMTATTIAPQNSASRAQAATILMNISTKGIMAI